MRNGKAEAAAPAAKGPIDPRHPLSPSGVRVISLRVPTVRHPLDRHRAIALPRACRAVTQSGKCSRHRQITSRHFLSLLRRIPSNGVHCRSPHAGAEVTTAAEWQLSRPQPERARGRWGRRTSSHTGGPGDDTWSSVRPLRTARAVPACRMGRRGRPRRARQSRLDPPAGRPRHLACRVLLAGRARHGLQAGLRAARLAPAALRGHRGALLPPPRASATAPPPIWASSTPSPACTATSSSPRTGCAPRCRPLGARRGRPGRRGRQAPRQALGRRAGAVPVRRRGRPGPLAAPGRLGARLDTRRQSAPEPARRPSVPSWPTTRHPTLCPWRCSAPASWARRWPATSSGRGHDVRAWNRTRAKAEPLAADGVRVTGTPAEAVDGRRRGPHDAARRARPSSTPCAQAAPALRPGAAVAPDEHGRHRGARPARRGSADGTACASSTPRCWAPRRPRRRAS